MSNTISGDEQGFSDEADDGIIGEEGSFGIANEFTGVKVRKVITRNGERLELATPKFGHRVLLDAMQLEVISTLTPEKFNELFARNLGSYEEPS